MRGHKPDIACGSQRSYGVLTIALALFAALLLSGCPKRPPQKRLPPRTKLPPKEVREPAKAPEQVATPERAASQRLVEKGVAMLDEGSFDRAANTFRDAVNIDTTNGVAYYYLAFARSRLDERDVALGLLDKAEALLSYDEDWLKRIDELRAELGADESHQVMPSPIDEAF